jgi:excisionase family DNA binding protein
VRLLTAQEVSEVLRLPRARVYQLGRAGLLPVVRVGRQLRVSEPALRAWVDAGGQGLPAPGTRKTER